MLKAALRPATVVLPACSRLLKVLLTGGLFSMAWIVYHSLFSLTISNFAELHFFFLFVFTESQNVLVAFSAISPLFER